MSSHEFHSGHHNPEDGATAGLLNDISSYTLHSLLHGPSSYRTSSTSSHVLYGAPARPYAPLPAHPYTPLSTTYGTPIRSQVMRQSFVAYDDVSIQDYEIPPTRSFMRGRNFSPPGNWQSEEPPANPRASSPPRMKALAELKPLALRELKEDETACIICMEDYVDVPDSTDELKTEHALQMGCGHHFGSYCLKIWEVDFVEEEEGRSMAMSRRWQSHQEMRRQGAQAAAARERNGPDSPRHHHAMGHRRRISTQSVDFTARRRDQSNYRGIRSDANPPEDSRVPQAPRLQPVDQQGNGGGQVPYREAPVPHIPTGLSPIRLGDTPLFAADMEMALCMTSPFLRHTPIINALPPRHPVHTPMIQRPQSMHPQAHQSLYSNLDMGRLPPGIPAMRGGPHQPYRHNPASPPPTPMAPTHQSPPNYPIQPCVQHSDYNNNQPQQMQYPEYRDQHWQPHQMSTMLPPPNTTLNSNGSINGINNINNINDSNTSSTTTPTTTPEDDLQQHEQHQHQQTQCNLTEIGYCIESFYTGRMQGNLSAMLGLDCGHSYHVICLVSITKNRPQQPMNRRVAWCQRCNRFEMLVDGELPDFSWGDVDNF
ncbi:hypothetical protein C7212DRAFT_349374 [Tuber magnatum]|uniref:Uncharacterized protein n=1 Tax=Tuber magnatum TaxID=42249 RepID=A0A317SWM4_9PEZI|nr:hypothetical protein C7212DRAFT_349374 [Tuber magnatum]